MKKALLLALLFTKAAFASEIELWPAPAVGITLAGSVGSSPNAAGATLSAGVLTFQPADATHPGVVTASGTQTFAGDKIFANIAATLFQNSGQVVVLQDANSHVDTIVRSPSSSTAGRVYLSNQSEHFAVLSDTGLDLTSNGHGGGLLLGTSGITFGDTTTQTTAATAPTIGTFGSSPTANGATVSGSAISLQPADGIHPGAITSGTQTLGGTKTWSGAHTFQSSVAVQSNLTVSTNTYNPTDTASFYGNKSDSSTTVGIRIGAGQALSTTGAKIVSFDTQLFSGTNTEKAYIDKDGAVVANSYGVGGNLGSSQGVSGSGANLFINTSTGSVSLRDAAGGNSIVKAFTGGDGASAVAVTSNTAVAYTTTGAKIHSFQNNSVEKTSVDKDGNVVTTGFISASNGYGNNGLGGATEGMAFSGSNVNIASGGDATRIALGSNSGLNFLKADTNGVDLTANSNARIRTAATDSSGTPGAATANTPSGQAAIAAAAGSVTITDSLVSATSIVQAVLQANDTTCVAIKSVVPGSGTFTINVNAACAGNTKVGWIVQN